MSFWLLWKKRAEVRNPTAPGAKNTHKSGDSGTTPSRGVIAVPQGAGRGKTGYSSTGHRMSKLRDKRVSTQ